jgi:hypothetical protein
MKQFDQATVARTLLVLFLLSLPLRVLATENFTPIETPAAVTASTVAASTKFTLQSAVNAPDVKVCNTGSSLAYWVCGNSSAQASVPGPGSNSTTMSAGLCGVYNKGSGSTTCSAITATGSTTVTFTAGQGQ